MTELDIPALGIRIEGRRTTAEQLEVIEGSMRLVMDGREHHLNAGDVMEVPPGTPHRQLPGDDGHGRVRVTVSPAGRTWEFLQRVALLRVSRWGFPGVRDAVALVRDFRAESRPALPRRASREYVFVDDWDVAAPRESVFAAIADARSYPTWWKPVYLDVDADGEPEVGKESRSHFKGRLPYHLRTRSRITQLSAPHTIGADVDGDLRGTGLWTLTETETGTHVRFDWRVHADRPLLRLLTPFLRPALRWNHAWAIARAREGLEPYARAVAAPVPTTAR